MSGERERDAGTVGGDGEIVVLTLEEEEEGGEEEEKSLT